MATYSVTVVVSCEDATEWSSFKTHLNAHGYDAVTGALPSGFDHIDLDEVAFVATLTRITYPVASGEWM